VAVLIVGGILTPAATPIAGLLGIRQLVGAPKELVLAALCAVALVLSTWTRLDTVHLTYIFAPTLVVTAWLIERWRVTKIIAFILLLSAALLFWNTVQGRRSMVAHSSRAGAIHATARTLSYLSAAESAIPAGASLFVYPYQPATYFLTRGVNVTPYSFLQPGMMADEDEQRALKYLRGNPPEYVVFNIFEPEFFLRIWPNSDPKKLRMATLENWIEQNYDQYSTQTVDGHRIMRRKP
jgi:hypothetical protein